MPKSTCYASDPIRYWANAILVADRYRDTIDTLSDLKGKDIASFNGASKALAPFIDPIIENANSYYEIQSSDIGARLLLGNRCHAYLGDIASISYFYNIHAKKKSNAASLKILHRLEPVPQFICFNHANLRDKFEKEFALFKTTSEYDALLKKYSFEPQ